MSLPDLRVPDHLTFKFTTRPDPMLKNHYPSGPDRDTFEGSQTVTNHGEKKASIKNQNFILSVYRISSCYQIIGYYSGHQKLFLSNRFRLCWVDISPSIINQAKIRFFSNGFNFHYQRELVTESRDDQQGQLESQIENTQSQNAILPVDMSNIPKNAKY